jgi:transposase InsO family protein
VIDYYSKWIAVEKLKNLSTNGLINALMNVFYVHGFPDVITSDNGPQYASKEFKSFCSQSNMKHITSSPYYPQSNGEAERGIKTVKNLWMKNTDKKLPIFIYNSSTIPALGYSPAQMLMNRRLKTDLPICQKRLKPEIPKDVTSKPYESWQNQKKYYDRKARKQPYAVLNPGETVLVQPQDSRRSKKQWMKGRIVEEHSTPDSYIIETEDGKIRRNRRYLRRCSKNFKTSPRSKLEFKEVNEKNSQPEKLTYEESSSRHESRTSRRPSTQPEIQPSAETETRPKRRPRTESETFNSPRRRSKTVPVSRPVTDVSRSGRPLKRPTRFQDYVMQ